MAGMLRQLQGANNVFFFSAALAAIQATDYPSQLLKVTRRRTFHRKQDFTSASDQTRGASAVSDRTSLSSARRFCSTIRCGMVQRTPTTSNQHQRSIIRMVDRGQCMAIHPGIDVVQ